MFVKVSLVTVFVTLLASCNAGKNKTNIELVQQMMDQESIKAQDWDPKQPGKAMMMDPPEGTVAKGFKPYPYPGDPIKAQEKLVNPIAGDFSAAVLEKGKTHFTIYCGVCHGASGKGDGTVAPKMTVKPPSLVTDKVKGFNDGRIYHIITDGQGVMSSYASQIKSDRARWAIVNYVRTLQKGAN